MNTTQEMDLQKAIQGTKQIIIELLSSIGHDAGRVEADADLLLTRILQLTLAKLLSSQPDSKELTEQLNELQKVDVVAVIDRLKAIVVSLEQKQVDEALQFATEQTLVFYFKQIGPHLDQEDLDRIMTFKNDLKNSLEK